MGSFYIFEITVIRRVDYATHTPRQPKLWTFARYRGCIQAKRTNTYALSFSYRLHMPTFIEM